ncbi:MAG: EthD family reductase [Bacteroidetes bacterium]|nr:EthD family reductase [Bacteroidota bacterium]
MTTKIKLFLLIFAFIGFTSCKTSQLKNAPIPEAGMYKVAIFYPNGEDKTFDMDYYEKKHMPMVASFLGENLKFYEIDKGISGRTPEDKASFVAIGYFYVQNVAEYGKAIAQNRDAIVNDFKNYTNIQPVIQINEIKQIKHNDIKK